MVELEGVREKGAIASERAAAIYGLDVLAEGIQVRVVSDPYVNSSRSLFCSFCSMRWPIPTLMYTFLSLNASDLALQPLLYEPFY